MRDSRRYAALPTDMILSAKAGDKEALDRIAQAFYPLLRAAASRFFIADGLFSREELVQAGYVGLMTAIAKYRPEANCTLSTCALPWILGEMKLAIRKAVDSTGMYDLRRKVAREEARLRIAFNRSPTFREVADACGVSETEIAAALQAGNRNEWSESENDALAMTALLSDNREQDALSLRMALEALDGEARRLILLRYFRDRTQTETARAMGKSQAQISRIERRALDRLRELLA